MAVLDHIDIFGDEYRPRDGESTVDTLTRAVREWARTSGMEDTDTIMVRHARLDGWSPDGCHERYECFVGHRTPPGHGDGERWTGRNLWVDYYYRTGTGGFGEET